MDRTHPHVGVFRYGHGVFLHKRLFLPGRVSQSTLYEGFDSGGCADACLKSARIDPWRLVHSHPTVLCGVLSPQASHCKLINVILRKELTFPC